MTVGNGLGGGEPSSFCKIFSTTCAFLLLNRLLIFNCTCIGQRHVGR